jgi:7-cyano-7-deazaguanine synthase in queuosine biosynthesis
MTKIIGVRTEGFEEKDQEDLEALEKVENLLKLKKLDLIKLPKHGESVVVVHSGGMDSTTNIAILMEEFKLKVYPLFINRGQTNLKYERESINYFSKIFKEKYPDLYNDSIEVELSSPPKAYKKDLKKVKTEESLKEVRVAYPARNPIILLTAAEYAYSLQAKGIFPKTIFVSFMKEDPPRHSALTTVRMMNLLLCQIMGDYAWQIISLPIEKEFNNFYGKEVFLKWATEHNLPIEKTRSCYKDQSTHCGQCYPACKNRKQAFKNANIEDKTEYIN